MGANTPLVGPSQPLQRSGDATGEAPRPSLHSSSPRLEAPRQQPPPPAQNPRSVFNLQLSEISGQRSAPPPRVDPYALRNQILEEESSDEEDAVLARAQPQSTREWGMVAQASVDRYRPSADEARRFPSTVRSGPDNLECVLAALATARGRPSWDALPGARGFDVRNHGDDDIARLLADNGFERSTFGDLEGHLRAGRAVWVRGPSLDGAGWHAYALRGSTSDGRALAWDPDGREGGFKAIALNRRFFDQIYVAR